MSLMPYDNNNADKSYKINTIIVREQHNKRLPHICRFLPSSVSSITMIINNKWQ